MDQPSNFCIRHILSFVICVELLVVEVHHLEIVIGRLRAASRRDRGAWGLCKICPRVEKKLLLGHKYRECQKGKHFYITEFLEPAGQPCGAKLEP